MLILIGVTVTAAINGGLFGKAKEGAERYQQEALNEANETVVVDGVEYASVEDYINGNRVYKPDEWIKAWTCSDGGTWSDTINAGEKAEGDIVAKLYTTGRKIKPEGFSWNHQNFTFNEGDEYHLVIEGSGTMGALMTTSGATITGTTGWHESTALYMAGASDTCIMPYVSKVIVGTGIKNIGGYAFAGDTGLKEIILPNSITSISEYSFMYCTNLSSITIPEEVTSINERAILYCTNLIKIKILATDATVGTDAFLNIAYNSKIYVLNETMKTRVDEKIYHYYTTVEVVTKEQMESL